MSKIALKITLELPAERKLGLVARCESEIMPGLCVK